MFLRYGIRSLTMDDIARELGVSKKTLYSNFRDKNNLILNVIEHELSQNEEFLKEIHSSKPGAMEEFLLLNSRVHFIRSRHSPSFYYDLKRYSPDAYGRLITERRDMISDMVKENLRKGKLEGIYRREIREQIIGKLYMAVMEMLENSDIFESHESLSPDFLRELSVYHLRGICNQKGLDELSQWAGYLDKQIAKSI